MISMYYVKYKLYLYFLKDLFQRVHMHVCMSSGRGEGKRDCQEDSLLSMEPKACGAGSHHPNNTMIGVETKSWTPNQLCHLGAPKCLYF